MSELRAVIRDDRASRKVLGLGPKSPAWRSAPRGAPAAAKLDRWLHELVQSHGDRVLAVDGAVADRWGRLNVPDRISAVDGMLAATALVHAATLVTRNVRHVERTGVRHLDPFA